tara:strand:- start:763 stop:951 length:189 start_codon:yes stop_codon:yes gene_type:complete
MSNEKVETLIELNSDTVPLIDGIIEKYKLKSRSKAFRVILDFIIESENDWDIIFKKRRCKRC